MQAIKQAEAAGRVILWVRHVAPAERCPRRFGLRALPDGTCVKACAAMRDVTCSNACHSTRRHLRRYTHSARMSHDAEVRRCFVTVATRRDLARVAGPGARGRAGARATHTHTLHPWKRVVKTKAIRTDKQKNGRLSRYDTVVCCVRRTGLYSYTVYIYRYGV